MSSESGYHVVYHHQGRVALQAATDAVLQSGWTPSQVEALLQGIEARLKADPHDFGEPHYRVPGTNLVVFVGFLRPFCVEFAVDDQKRVVLVRNFMQMKAGEGG